LYTFGFYYYFLEDLFSIGYEEEAIELIRRYYGRWLDVGATTFGEHFRMSRLKGKALDFEYEVQGYGTSAHAHFYTNLLGVRPLEPGFTSVLLAPRPGDLQWACGTVSTPQCVVRVAWEQNAASFAIDVQMPAGCGYRVELPARFRDTHISVKASQPGPRGWQRDGAWGG